MTAGGEHDDPGATGGGGAADTPGGVDAAPAPAALIEIVKGNPTDEEVAALIAALRALTTGGDQPGHAGSAQRNMWGHPVDKLRYPIFSWHRVILQERTHLRR